MKKAGFLIFLIASNKPSEYYKTKGARYMNILNIRDGCAAVMISRSELEDFGVTYDSLDYSSDKTKLIIRFALEKINEKADDPRFFERGMTIEALPDSDGGCMLFFNFTKNSGRALIKNEPEFYTAESPDFENLCAFCASAEKLNLFITSSLYKKNGAYRLVFSSCRLSREGTEDIMSEFADVKPARAVNETYEYWDEVIGDNAAETLAEISAGSRQ